MGLVYGSSHPKWFISGFFGSVTGKEEKKKVDVCFESISLFFYGEVSSLYSA